LSEKPLEDSTIKDENSGKSREEVDVHAKARSRITTQQVFGTLHDDIDVNALLVKVPSDVLELFIASLLAKVPPDMLGLFIMNSAELLLVELAERITLGRQSEDTGTSISVDLTPCGGAKLGVSRQHAVILIDQDEHLLQDLDSTNGTWLNETRLPPHVSHALKNGDMIGLGQIKMYVVLHS
jgi:hypothetical protein